LGIVNIYNKQAQTNKPILIFYDAMRPCKHSLRGQRRPTADAAIKFMVDVGCGLVVVEVDSFGVVVVDGFGVVVVVDPRLAVHPKLKMEIQLVNTNLKQ